jgi:hypothetical protein
MPPLSVDNIRLYRKISLMTLTDFYKKIQSIFVFLLQCYITYII